MIMTLNISPNIAKTLSRLGCISPISANTAPTKLIAIAAIASPAKSMPSGELLNILDRRGEN